HRQFGGRNFLSLKAQQVELLGVGLFINDQPALLLLQSRAAAQQLRKIFAHRTQASKRIEYVQLSGGVQKRLVVVRTMDINEPLAQRAEAIEGGGRTIYELPV